MKKHLFYGMIAAFFLIGCGEGSGGSSKVIGSDNGGNAVEIPTSATVESVGVSNIETEKMGSDSAAR